MANLKLKLAPFPKGMLLKVPSSAATSCCVLSWFSQVTMPPALMVTVTGSNADPFMITFASTAAVDGPDDEVDPAESVVVVRVTAVVAGVVAVAELPQPPRAATVISVTASAGTSLVANPRNVRRPTGACCMA